MSFSPAKRPLSPPSPVDAAVPAPSQAQPKKQKRVRAKKYRAPAVDPTSVQGVLREDITALLHKLELDPAAAKNDMTAFVNRDRSQPWPAHRQVELQIESLSSVGVGLAVLDNKAIVVPYTLPGDKVVAKIYRTEEYYYEAEMVEVVEKAPLRNDELVKCQYFGKCSGCQYQMVSYDEQLKIKQQVVVDAFKHYAAELFKSGRLPQIHDTVASPLQYGYRTKLTPHFDIPRKHTGNEPVPIGFGERGRKDVLDIEECIIGTPVLNEGLTVERKKVLDNISKYKRGATILLREDMEDDEKVCVTDNKAIITEQVGEFKFRFPAGTFFQNNNSILPRVTEFVRDHIKIANAAPKFLVDTYCGSGLFGITCSPAVERVIGVEISKESVEYATKNAELNGIKNTEFITGQAERIFEKVSDEPEKTAVVIDPPRKGCDKLFLDQLLAFRPAKIVYVSCNVHSQARDLEYFLANSDYSVESLGGFDFFPQTYHVEGVAVLSRPA